jgi:hypothetical protein
MIDFKFRPGMYFIGDVTSILLVKLHYPESKWGEQISIYAHSADTKINFEAVDFYGNEYILYPSSALEPLSLEELIDMLEGMQINRDHPEGNMVMTLDGFPEAKSHLYPQLHDYYQEKRQSLGLD